MIKKLALFTLLCSTAQTVQAMEVETESSRAYTQVNSEDNYDFSCALCCDLCGTFPNRETMDLYNHTEKAEMKQRILEVALEKVHQHKHVYCGSCCICRNNDAPEISRGLCYWIAKICEKTCCCCCNACETTNNSQINKEECHD